MRPVNDAGGVFLKDILTTMLTHQFDKHLSNAAYAATASQSGEMQGLR